MAPIRIQAQALRRKKAAAQADAMGAFPIVLDDPDEPPKKKTWRQADVKRAIAAAEEAGLSSYRVEVASDGTISVIVGDPADTADPNPYRDLRG